jgi:hypothetical protein
MSSGVAVNLTVSDEQKRQLAADLAGIKNGVAKACAQAINKTLATGRATVTKRLAPELAIKQKLIREQIGVRKADYKTQRGYVTIRKKSLPLYDFNPIPKLPLHEARAAAATKGKKPPKRPAVGISVKVRPGRGRQVLAHTFIARMKSGHVGIFERAGRGGKRVPRKVIKERWGPTPLGVFLNAPGIAEDVLAKLGGTLAKNLESQVDYLLAKSKADTAAS